MINKAIVNLLIVILLFPAHLFGQEKKPEEKPEKKPEETREISEDPDAKQSEDPDAKQSEDPDAKQSEDPDAKQSQTPNAKKSKAPGAKKSKARNAKKSKAPAAKRSKDPKAEKIARNKLITGISLSATGAVVTIIGGLFYDELTVAKKEYFSFDGSESLENLKAAEAAVTKYRLRFYIPMITGFALSAIGLGLAFDGSSGIPGSERGTYKPNISPPKPRSWLIISPGFTGLRIRH